MELSRRLNHKRVIAESYHFLGRVNHLQGQHSKAEEYYQRSLSLFQNMKSKLYHFPILNLYELCLLNLDQQKSNQVTKYLNELKDLMYTSDLKSPLIYSQLAEVHFLKQSKRFKEKSKAQDILQKLLEEENLTYQIRYTCRTLLSDLMLEEVMVFGDEELFDETKPKFKQLTDLISSWNFKPANTKNLVLQAKLTLVEESTDQTFVFLDEANAIAE
ncbi:MAG: tetratricopeptide repeat protein [Candidatus Hodarchaeota archaeon]